MILTTSISLSYFTGLEYTYCIIWIGIADVVPIALTPFVVLLLAKRIEKYKKYCTLYLKIRVKEKYA